MAVVEMAVVEMAVVEMAVMADQAGGRRSAESSRQELLFAQSRQPG
jgi:hypothetical protein